MINFSLLHNVICFSFVVVLHFMYSLYAISKVVLLIEKVVMCNNNLRLKVQMKCCFFFIAEFERAAKIRKIAVYRFLISLLVPEL